MLGTLADRYPRRAIMLACDLLRLVLIAGLAVVVGHSPPLLVVYLVLLLSEFVAMPFGTARAALYVDVVPDRADYITAQGLSRTVYLLTQVVGAIVGGFLVDLVGVGPTLAFDALTFLFSFLVVRLYVVERGVADEPRDLRAPAPVRTSGSACARSSPTRYGGRSPCWAGCPRCSWWRRRRWRWRTGPVCPARSAGHCSPRCPPGRRSARC